MQNSIPNHGRIDPADFRGQCLSASAYASRLSEPPSVRFTEPRPLPSRARRKRTARYAWPYRRGTPRERAQGQRSGHCVPQKRPPGQLSRIDVDNPPPDRDGNRLRPVVYVQLCKDVLDMALRGFVADTQACRYLL